jgi:hypothetical protein
MFDIRLLYNVYNKFRQLQEKCIEQNVALFQVFVDLTKAFDTA